MLKIIIPSIMLIPLTWFSSNKKVWINVTSYSFIINMIALVTLWQVNDNTINFSTMFSTDSLSSPLTMLTIWLLPLMLLASQNHIKNQTYFNKKMYISLLITLQVLLIMTFSANELII